MPCRDADVQCLRPHAAPPGDVLITDELARRPARAPDPQAENHFLKALIRRLREPNADTTILQAVADAALALCRAGSAGVSILESVDGAGLFRWHGAAGRWQAHSQATRARDASPCGLVLVLDLDLDRPLLLRHPERHFGSDASAMPPLVELLPAPFTVAGRKAGTVWVVCHDEGRGFDAEDLRLLTELSELASVAHQLTQQRRQLHESLERERAGARLLQSISGGMVLEDDAGTLYAQILDAAQALMNAPCVSLQRAAADGGLELLA